MYHENVSWDSLISVPSNKTLPFVSFVSFSWIFSSLSLSHEPFFPCRSMRIPTTTTTTMTKGRRMFSYGGGSRPDMVVHVWCSCGVRVFVSIVVVFTELLPSDAMSLVLFGAVSMEFRWLDRCSVSLAAGVVFLCSANSRRLLWWCSSCSGVRRPIFGVARRSVCMLATVVVPVGGAFWVSCFFRVHACGFMSVFICGGGFTVSGSALWLRRCTARMDLGCGVLALVHAVLRWWLSSLCSLGARAAWRISWWRRGGYGEKIRRWMSASLFSPKLHTSL